MLLGQLRHPPGVHCRERKFIRLGRQFHRRVGGDPDHRPRLLESSPTTRDVWQAGSPGLSSKVAQLGATSDQPVSLADLANSLA